jgi:LysM repeat protein
VFDRVPSKTNIQKAQPSVLTHTIEKGETLHQLTKKYSVTLSQLLLWNPNIEIKKLSISTKIKLEPKPRNHTIKEGETLYQLTKKYGVTLSQLLLWNPNMIIKKLSVATKIKLRAEVNSI